MATDTLPSKLYGVASGNGNDGVSHMYANYYVRTNDPWRLAELALLAEFKPSGIAWAKSHSEIDGESDYTISAVIYNPPCEDTKDGEYPTLYRCAECELTSDSQECGQCGESCDELDYEEYEDGRNWCDGNGAWLIVEVYPIEDGESRDGYPVYDSIEDAFSADLVATVPAE
jgi:hypothetical protein